MPRISRTKRKTSLTDPLEYQLLSCKSRELSSQRDPHGHGSQGLAGVAGHRCAARHHKQRDAALVCQSPRTPPAPLTGDQLPLGQSSAKLPGADPVVDAGAQEGLCSSVPGSRTGCHRGVAAPRCTNGSSARRPASPPGTSRTTWSRYTKTMRAGAIAKGATVIE